MSETPQSTRAVKDLVWRDAALLDATPGDKWNAWAIDASASLDLGDRTVRARISPTVNVRLLAVVAAVWLVVFAASTAIFAQLTGLPTGHGEVAVLFASAASIATWTSGARSIG